MKKTIIATGFTLGTVLLAATVWATRYHYIPEPERGTVIRENRWTGQTCTLGSVPNPKYRLYTSGNPIDDALTKPTREQKDTWDAANNANEPERIRGWTDCN